VKVAPDAVPEAGTRRCVLADVRRLAAIILDAALYLQHVDHDFVAIMGIHGDVGTGIDEQVVEDPEAAEAELVRRPSVAQGGQSAEIPSTSIPRLLDERSVGCASNENVLCEHRPRSCRDRATRGSRTMQPGRSARFANRNTRPKSNATVAGHYAADYPVPDHRPMY
jgi:hypothetical protein